MLIAMLDRDYSGKMGFSEFKELWAALSQWKVKIAPRIKINDCYLREKTHDDLWREVFKVNLATF